MTNLIIMHDQKAVTSSVSVAKSFNKRHDNVIRDIEEYKKDVLNFEDMFFETYEPDSYNRDRKVYMMNRDGFSLLAMGFTGKEALQFKLKYIQAFNDFESSAKTPKPLTEREQLKAALKLSLETEERIESVENKIEDFEKKFNDENRLLPAETDDIYKAVVERSVHLVKSVYPEGAIGNEEFKKEVGLMRRRMWSRIKKRYGVSKYIHMKRKDYDDALQYIKRMTILDLI